jgi:hypothetical protein
MVAAERRRRRGQARGACKASSAVGVGRVQSSAAAPQCNGGEKGLRALLQVMSVAFARETALCAGVTCKRRA